MASFEYLDSIFCNSKQDNGPVYLADLHREQDEQQQDRRL